MSCLFQERNFWQQPEGGSDGGSCTQIIPGRAVPRVAKQASQAVRWHETPSHPALPGSYTAVSQDVAWLTWHGQDRWGDVGLLVDLDVVAKPVDLHRLRRAHSLAREVEGTVLGDIQLLRLTNEVWEPCTDQSRESRDSESLETQPYQQPQTALPGAVPSSSSKPLPI